jgi:hypothetical protein
MEHRIFAESSVVLSVFSRRPFVEERRLFSLSLWERVGERA